jgi:ParB family chromosome partitioning protein
MGTDMRSAMEEALRPAAKAAPTVHSAQKARLETIPVDYIDIVSNVRKTFNPQKLEELAASIVANGIIQPLVVRVIAGRYKLVAGERRLRAAIKAGLEEVPCVVRDMGDAKATEAQLVENTHREAMNAVDEAFGVRALHEKLGLTAEVTATRLGKSDFYVCQMLALTELPRRALDAMRRGVINRTGAYEIAKVADPKKRAEVIARVLPEGSGRKWEGRHVAASRIKSVVRAVLARERGEAPVRTRAPKATTTAAVMKFWRHFLLTFDAREWDAFKGLCEGRSDAGVMAEAVAKVVAGRKRPH